MSMSNSLNFFPFSVAATIGPCRYDHSAEAQFVSIDRAEQYLKMLIESGEYITVILTDATDGMTTTFYTKELA